MKTLVILNSADSIPYRRATRGVLSILEHLGIFFEVVDLAWSRLAEQELRSAHLILLGQEGIARSLSEEEVHLLIRQVSQGLGLLLLDGFLPGYSSTLLRMLGVENFHSGKTEAIRLVKPDWITETSSLKEVPLKRPLSCYFWAPSLEGWTCFLKDDQGNPVGLRQTLGRGRVVIFGVSAGLWQEEYLGHAAGLDGVFWRSLIWCTRKPFLARAMPPLLTARIDDVSGSGSPVATCKETVSKLKYLEVLNRYGFIPNLGIFVDDLGPEDMKTAKTAFHESRAEFSAHAFRDPSNINEFPIYLKHTGEEFPQETLKEHFEKLDRFFSYWSLKPAQTVNAHFGEIGLASLPFLKQRGQHYLMNVCRVGKSFADPTSHSWELKPYQKLNFSLDFIPEDPEFFQALALPGLDFSAGKPDFDFLYGCTPFWQENSQVDIQGAVRRGSLQIRQGLENLFFGCLMTHEQRIGYLTLQQWEEIIKSIVQELRSLPHIFKSYDAISAYAESRARTNLLGVEHNQGELTLSLKGSSVVTQLVYLFLDEGSKIRQQFLEIPPFSGSVVLTFRV
ncbi:MAG: hypothetical protein NC911_07900 [Candidatus Omnitrophica bacterium]|nr:hypothetical protein [Candidatus Omnitrophota bacterium]